MDLDGDLLFGLAAVHANLISPIQLQQALSRREHESQRHLIDILIDEGLLVPQDKRHIEYLVGRQLEIAGVHRIDENLEGQSKDETTVYSHGRVGPYKLLEHHATGGIGKVWIANDPNLGRKIALKELRAEYLADQRLHHRFLKEAQITGQLEHPNIVPVYEMNWHAGQPYYAMRFIKGQTLSEACKEFHRCNRMSESGMDEFQRLMNAFVVVCKTIAFAHSRGVVHRDIKGPNVVLGDFGEVVVLDWGLAKWTLDPESPLDDGIPDSSHDDPVTLHGQRLGTPAYMAPEQASGHNHLVDERTDVYGLGALLYEILTGAPPFDGSDTKEILRKVQHEPPVPPSQSWEAVPPLF